jgi:hypothetical protein
MKKRKPILTPLFKDKDFVPLQPLEEIQIHYSILPLVAIQIHLPYKNVDTLFVLDTDLPIGNLAYIHGIPLLQRDIPYRVVLYKEKVPPKRFFFKQIGYTFGYENIVDIRDEEGDPLIPDLSIHFVHSNYKLIINRSPFTVRILVDNENENTEGGLAYKGQEVEMNALECSFLVVGNLFVDHDEHSTFVKTFS